MLILNNTVFKLCMALSTPLPNNKYNTRRVENSRKLMRKVGAASFGLINHNDRTKTPNVCNQEQNLQAVALLQPIAALV